MNGLHITADLSGCAPAALMIDITALAQASRAATEAAGLTVVGDHWHRFPDAADGQPGGVTGMLLLAESHVALHTWPELGAVTLDVYVCNYGGDNAPKAEALMAHLTALFQPTETLAQRLVRGRLGATGTTNAHAAHTVDAAELAPAGDALARIEARDRA
ncbi:S-adenosylmethionine decarboxylase family protein [Roseateles amylovorans]|uniref:S-adenosylmethionine decarboxylase n=1 Tax=Roseateles amylovorans TaxID=2978473 RepID=A0ABY6AXF2_9BURK|nr:S-adenosylmethionine decarboxylase [Roseateles amylovorans]UXH77864.1 S-adenosylmethionine decarboxylase [Roseateles amylovorans]